MVSITTSQERPPSAAPRASRSERLAVSASTPAGTGREARPRVTMVTWWPASHAAATMAEERKPVPPMMRRSMCGLSFGEAGRLSCLCPRVPRSGAGQHPFRNGRARVESE
uniref:Uncharacterized protein n=1 Tax=uncultured Armatimonadetes bacterium TaxID=157466 RepID=A0A6J4JG81_9BACT|nr:hypothetical protein AVDCRST_MAG63-3402 [uncultured Armatimonadetes bacterium]